MILTSCTCMLVSLVYGCRYFDKLTYHWWKASEQKYCIGMIQRVIENAIRKCWLCGKKYHFISNHSQDGAKNNKPIYRKLGNRNLFLAYSNVLNDKYPVPWTMWGGPVHHPGDHIGNIKIGPSNLSCPEQFSVCFKKHMWCNSNILEVGLLIW